MAERRHWGRAGIPLTQQEVAALHHKVRSQRNQAAASKAADDAAAVRMWRAGMVRPAAITFALDAKGLYGPEVDRACLAEEPEVDMWEAGTLYPTWEQLCALAELTGNTARFFCLWGNPLPFEATTLRFHVPKFDVPPLVWSYPREVVAATVAGPAGEGAADGGTGDSSAP